MKRLINILVFCCLCLPLFGQEEEMFVIDSMRSIMAKQEGASKIETMTELARALFDVSYDDCISMSEMAIVEAEKLGDEKLLSWTHWKIGKRFMNHYDFDLAHEHFEKALELLENKEESEWLMYALNSKGHVEILMGNLDLALSTCQRNLSVSENLGDELNYADVLNNMAYIYFQRDDLDKAMECFLDARQRYGRVQDTLSMTQCDNNISNIYVQWQQYDKALMLLKHAIPVFEQNDDEASLAHAYQNLGTVYAIGHVNLDSSLVYLQKSIVCAENVGDKITLVEDEIELANVLKLLGRKSEAISLYQSALHSSETMGYLNGMLEAYKNLGIHYNEVGDFTTSAIYLKRCMDLAAEKGNQLYVNSVRPYLIADYAHLGHYVEMSKELGLFRENYENIIGESNALDEELAHLRENVDGLLSQYTSQSLQLATLQSQRNHYRLAFFGLLAIAISAVAVWIFRRILLHNRHRSK